MDNHPVFDQAKAAAFAGKAMSDASSAAVMVMAYLGDRLHLFKAMADCGPVSSTELAAAGECGCPLRPGVAVRHGLRRVCRV